MKWQWIIRALALATGLALLGSEALTPPEARGEGEGNSKSRAGTDEEKEPSAEPDAAAKALEKLMRRDDRAMAEVDRWIREHQADEVDRGVVGRSTLNARIENRLQPIREAYRRFLRRYPDHAKGHLAFGSFLNDLGETKAAKSQWEEARKLDPSNPAVWNNQANYHGEEGNPEKAFKCYEKAISLRPQAALYYHNLGKAMSLYRKEAAEYYDLTEQEVLQRILELYRKARKRDPDNFPLATDLARTYYAIKPPQPVAAITAWKEALELAHDATERQGVQLHLARWKLRQSKPTEAKAHLHKVTLTIYKKTKAKLEQRLKKVKGER